MLMNRRIIVCLILTFLIEKNVGTGSERRHKKVDSLLLAEEKAGSLDSIGGKDKESPPPAAAGTRESDQRNIDDNEGSQRNAETELAQSLFSLSTMDQQQLHGPQLATSLLPQKKQLAPSLFQQDQLTSSQLPQKRQLAGSLLEQRQMAASLLQKEQQDIFVSSLLQQKRQLAPSLLQERQMGPNPLGIDQLGSSQLPQKRQLAPSLLQQEQLAPSQLPQKRQMAASLLQERQTAPSLLQKEQQDQLAPSQLPEKRQLAPSLLQERQMAPSLLQQGQMAPSLLPRGKLASSLLSPTVMLNFGTQQVEQIYDGQPPQRQTGRRQRPRLSHSQNISEHIQTTAAAEASQKGEGQQQVTAGALANPVGGASLSPVANPSNKNNLFAATLLRENNGKIMHSFIQSYPDEIEQKYEIAIGVKRYDGGDVMLLKKNENKPIEEVLSRYYGMKNVEYVPYGQLKYNGQVYKIVDFINAIVAKGDKKWLMPKQEQQGSHLFRPIFDGHIMVALFDSNGNERVRFHFNHYGLNVYRKWNGNNYLIEDEKEPEDDGNRVSDEGTRGWYQRQFFKEHLFTRPITVRELKRIALHEVIHGRKWSIDKGFSCRHFAYEFVLSIVDKPTAEALMRDFYKWPKPLVDYDQFITRYYDIDVKAYDKSVQEYYYRTLGSRT